CRKPRLLREQKSVKQISEYKSELGQATVDGPGSTCTFPDIINSNTIKARQRTGRALQCGFMTSECASDGRGSFCVLDKSLYINIVCSFQSKMPFVPKDEEMVLGVSKYGVKVDVQQSHPLYLIVRMLCYDDGLGSGKNLLALKTTDAKQQEWSICVYQWSSTVSVCVSACVRVHVTDGPSSIQSVLRPAV
uniref:Integrin beta 1 binding protein 1 n=1 Tax=Hucho hucho TaxID=62062 RepID=A0A4W5QS30_9TELE